MNVGKNVCLKFKYEGLWGKKRLGTTEIENSRRILGEMQSFSGPSGYGM